MTDLYNFAKEEFSLEDSEGETKLVYAYFGLAIYQAQCLEQSLGLMLITNEFIEKKPRNPEESKAIVDLIEKSKKTMGMLLTEVKKNYPLKDDELNQLDFVLAKRNYLAHNYFALNIEKFYSEKGKLEMIRDFCDYIAKARVIDQKLQIYYREHSLKLGITQQMIEELTADLKKAEMERVHDNEL